MQDFLSHYGITPQRCRPYRPRTKGKVERAIQYLKDSFIKGREFADLADLRAQGGHWQDEIANVRVHATTGARPIELLAREGLTPLSTIKGYRISSILERVVGREGFVRLGGGLRPPAPPVHGGQHPR